MGEQKETFKVSLVDDKVKLEWESVPDGTEVWVDMSPTMAIKLAEMLCGTAHTYLKKKAA